ncbi:bifunctional adenosylcobinamide kinase/adenosylcobinamide-phosphate guanylyltransferase [Leptospira barantonii]|uniref:Adenosylcobinamide kinase n=1 Tax=Leptospira barantonii TaxID=2023184 RepID=A0A5F2BDL8_9LEPT|nr:bifunctional adenosylcobinamide kinase/adenosylcobinamide-phosphate guanylyltransferase [Leptospira barantonii]TGM03651.1 bifunctional adenosylcobinamide kinase/adenosylcobinamide-phosphate guanylyltransferase [Leptospira barantonii]
MADIILITGGCRSGKSKFALNFADKFEGLKFFIATCPNLDEEMNQRILKHKEERQALSWETIEEEFDLSNVFTSGRFPENSVVLVDCLSLWVNNLLYRSTKENTVFNETNIQELCSTLTRIILNSSFKKAIFVSSEVGLGLVPENKTGRIYRDLLGTCNQTIAHNANETYFMVSGIPLQIKGNQSNKVGAI